MNQLIYICEKDIHKYKNVCYPIPMEDLLTKAGLSDVQAGAYLYLLDHGEATPPLISKAINVTRTNAYKVLDQLEAFGLVERSEKNKKFMYRAADPTALASLVAEERNRVIALEQTVKEAMQQLRAKYRKSTETSQITSGHGQTSLIHAYEQQADQKQTIHFIKSRADIPFMGFEAMDRVRNLTKRTGSLRFGIVPDGAESPTNLDIDVRTNLTRTWIPQDQYTAPVEWTANDNELVIQVFEGDGRFIRIQDQTVAKAFQQIWEMVDVNIRANPKYVRYGPKSNRGV
jgi:predicted transcriptional regulator